MLQFFKAAYTVFRCIREVVISLFFILFVLVCVALSALLSGENENTAPPIEEGVLMLNLDGYLADNHDEFSDFNRMLQAELGEDEPLKISTFDVVRAINQAKYDSRVRGLLLDFTYFVGGDIPSLNFVGQAIKAFKQESGKPVIAIGEYYSQPQYYLASFADKVLLNKSGFVELHGLNYSNLYFKSLFEKIEAVPHIFRVGTYKSAVEPFMRDDMSPEARANAQLWLGSLWQNFRKDVAQNRTINVADVLPEFDIYRERYKKANGDDALYALNQKLVNQLGSRNEINQVLTEHFGEDYQVIDYFDYEKTLSNRFNVNAEHKIAVINVEGEIVWGESDEVSAGSDTLIQQLQAVQDDERVVGVILRVNSPGGSAMASELIRQELADIQAKGIPVVTSMGGMAASGGYWIAATSDKIVASPNTITGSIGIFGLALTFEKTAKKLGISEDGIASSPLAAYSELKTLSPELGELIQISVDNGYQRFLELVSQGRKMPKAQVDNVAQGQVWLGEKAFELGLVDKLGDFHTAYDELLLLINEKRKAQDQAELNDVPAQWFIAESEDLLSSFMREFKLSLKFRLSNWLDLPLTTKLEQQLGVLSKFNDPKQSYLYCLNCGTVK